MYCIEIVSIVCFIDQSDLTDRSGEMEQLYTVWYTSIIIYAHYNAGSQQKTQSKKFLVDLEGQSLFYICDH